MVVGTVLFSVDSIGVEDRGQGVLRFTNLSPSVVGEGDGFFLSGGL